MKRIFILLVVLVLGGCLTAPRAPQVPPLAPPALQAAFPGQPLPDLSALEGRRICLDPGHGGPWPGAVAPSNGLRECDVNLRVALRLRELLETAGTTATMTRDSDTALDPESMAHDLALRGQLAQRAHAELFVSIHHNADIAQGSTRNDLEVFYKRGECGPSLDLGQCLTRELAQRLKSDAQAKRLLPGNYKVLRQLSLPAVLLESSFMTNADNAAFLATDRAADMEAKAILAGLAAYFAMDPPSVQSMEVAELDGARTHQLVVRFSRGIPIDGNTVGLTLDGAPALGELDFIERGLVWTFQGILPNGAHRVVVRGRNFQGAAFEGAFEFAVVRPPYLFYVTQKPEYVQRSARVEVLWEVHVFDSLGLPVADGTEVILVELDRKSETAGGTARLYFRPDEVDVACNVVVGTLGIEQHVQYGDVSWKTVRSVDKETGAPVSGVLVAAGRSHLGITNDEGWMALPGATEQIRLARTGYEPDVLRLRKDHTIMRLMPSQRGVLHQRTIVIDPDNGGTDPGALGRLGTRACDISLDVAMRTAGYLRAAGATVILTRIDDTELTEGQRLTVAQESGTDIFVRVSFGMSGTAARIVAPSGFLTETPESFVAHYPNSAKGSQLAQAIAAALHIKDVTPSVCFILQQTACPAVVVQPGNVASDTSEQVYASVAARRQVARALFRGICKYFQARQGSGQAK